MIKHFTITLQGNLLNKGYKLRTMLLASQHQIFGTVSECNQNIIIEAEGSEENLREFLEKIESQQSDGFIQSISIKKDITTLSYYEEFSIL